MPPMMAVEVTSSSVRGAVLVIGTRLSINMTSLTLDQQAGRRKKLLGDMGARGHGLPACCAPSLDPALV